MRLAKNEPVHIDTIVVPDPGPGEALVSVQACGVCHTDLHYRDGGISDDFPFLLGHEASGLVDAVGAGVSDVAPGDFVVLNWRAVCGRCRACLRGEPWCCFDTHNATQRMTLANGTPLAPALGRFAQKTLVHARQCTKVDPAVSPAVAGLLGCGVMAGLGAALNTGGVRRGQSVAVIGCGGVGCAAIAGARLASAAKIIAVDIDDRKLRTATTLGATHTVNSTSTDAIEAIRELTGGFGADVVIDAVGRPETYRQAFYACDLAGTLVLVGVPTPQMRLDLPLLSCSAAAVRSSRAGTATACRSGTSRCSWTCTCRAGCRWTPSSPRRSASMMSRTRSPQWPNRSWPTPRPPLSGKERLLVRCCGCPVVCVDRLLPGGCQELKFAIAEAQPTP